MHQSNSPELIQVVLEAQSGRAEAQVEMEKMCAASTLQEQHLRTEAQATIFATQVSAEAAVSKAEHQRSERVSTEWRRRGKGDRGDKAKAQKDKGDGKGNK